ncbi:MAG: DnaB-like helicase C-terminal domain-containing protein, partial [Bacteroidales bacterium]
MNPEAWGQPGNYPPKSESNEISREFLEGLASTSHGLEKELVSVTVEWGITYEDRLTYNRKGRRLDGSTYFIREEDRIELGDSYIGKIDPEAIVVVLRAKDKHPVTALTFYTGHPVTGYNPEHMASFGQWPQVACEKLSNYLGGVPVAFFSLEMSKEQLAMRLLCSEARVDSHKIRSGFLSRQE